MKIKIILKENIEHFSNLIIEVDRYNRRKDLVEFINKLQNNGYSSEEIEIPKKLLKFYDKTREIVRNKLLSAINEIKAVDPEEIPAGVKFFLLVEYPEIHRYNSYDHKIEIDDVSILRNLKFIDKKWSTSLDKFDRWGGISYILSFGDDSHGGEVEIYLEIDNYQIEEIRTNEINEPWYGDKNEFRDIATKQKYILGLITKEFEEPGYYKKIKENLDKNFPPTMVYTARPSEDDDLYNKARETKTIPVGIWVSNGKNHIIDYAKDLATKEEPRSIYAIKIRKNYLRESGGSGMIKYYTVFGIGKTVPILSIEFLGKVGGY